MQASKLTQLLLYFCCFFSFAACLTKRLARVKILYNTPYSISGVGLNHMYSDVYKESKTWESIPPYQKSSDHLIVNYHTGFGTSGRDWWAISGHNDLDPIGPTSMSLWYSNPENFWNFIDALESVAPIAIGAALKVAKLVQPQLAPIATVANIVSKALCSAMLNNAKTDGYKQHILTEADENNKVLIQINNDGTINIKSPSGQSDTVYNTKIQQLGLSEILCKVGADYCGWALNESLSKIPS